MSGSHLCIPIYETVQPHYFQNRIIMFCLPVTTLIYLWEIYIFPGSVCLFCCSHICGRILGIYKSLTDTWMRKLGLRLRNSQNRNASMGFWLQCTGRNILLHHVEKMLFDVLWTSNHFRQLGKESTRRKSFLKPYFQKGFRKKTFFFVTSLGFTYDRACLSDEPH